MRKEGGREGGRDKTYQELMSAAKRREGAFNCACRAATASSKVFRHSMSI